MIDERQLTDEQQAILNQISTTCKEVWEHLISEQDFDQVSIPKARKRFIEEHRRSHPQFNVRAEPIPDDPYGFNIVLESKKESEESV